MSIVVPFMQIIVVHNYYTNEIVQFVVVYNQEFILG